MLLAVLSGFLLALVAPAIHRITRNLTGWLLALLPVGLFLYFASHADSIAHGETIRVSYAWVSSLGVDLSFLLDGLSLLMVLIVTGIGALIFIYAAGYMKGDPYLGRFYSYLLIFMAAMVGLVLSDNLLGLFVFWELTSISSYLLIGFKHNYADSRTAALKALVVTGAGGLAMLAGFVLLIIVSGTAEISALMNQADLVTGHSLYLPILILIGLGAFTKSAQFPFHFWLPGAMAAPTPVSAYLHSATMVKAGVFLLARLSPVLSGTDEWRILITLVGGFTMLMGAYLSLKPSDLKRILAYSTVSSLGMLTMLLGWDTKVSVEAAMLFLLVHSLYKGTLFMVAGAIDHETGTRNIEQLGGLLRVMPFIALGAILAALSMSGIPPFLGFIGKELVYEATLGYESAEGLMLSLGPVLVTAAAVLSNMAAIAVACLVTIRPFGGQMKETPKHAHRAPLTMWFGPVALGGLALILGVLPHIPGEYIVGPAAGVVYGSALELHLALWHGITPMLILSSITIAGGVAIFWQRDRLLPLLNAVDVGGRFGPERLFTRTIDNLPYTARSITLIFQNGYLRFYVATIVATLVAVVGFTLFSRVDIPQLTSIGPVRFYEIVIAGVILIGVFLVLRSGRLLFTVIALGVIGYGVALIYILYSAPDLAMTQFAIETLSVVLFMLVLYRLPKLAQLSTMRARIRDAIIASSAGLLVTILVLVITSEPLASELSDFFAASSYPDARGRNIVNVILVDFRGFDTLGEITVLSVAAIGVYALLKLRIGPVNKTKIAEVDTGPDNPKQEGADA